MSQQQIGTYYLLGLPTNEIHKKAQENMSRKIAH